MSGREPAGSPPEPGFRYWAFISYSHADESWARWLHRALEGYRVPARLVGQRTGRGEVPKRIFPVFRDRDELAGSAELGPELQKALRESRMQIVICSPNAARSRWVNEEIRYFKSLDRADRVLALIVDGEPHAADRGQAGAECFPEALKFQVDAQGNLGAQPAEPIAADARQDGDGKANAKLKLIAGILGLGFNDLKQRELQARNRRLGVIAALASGVSAVTILLAIQAYQARNDAWRRQQQAEDLIEFMLGDLRDKLEPIGRLAILDSVGAKAMAYFATLETEDQTDAALASRAKAMRQIGEVRMKQGNLPGAVESFEEALELDLELVARHPDDPKYIHNIAQSRYQVGYGYYEKGQYAESQEWWDAHLADVERLLALEPDNPKWRELLGDAHSNLGVLAYARGDRPAARGRFEACRSILTQLVADHPDQATFQSTLWRVLGWLALLEGADHQWAPAAAHAREQSRIMRGLLAREPGNAEYLYSLANSLQMSLYNGLKLAPLAPDHPELQESLRISGELAELDPENVEYARSRAVSLAYLEYAHVFAGDLAAAADANAATLAIARALYRGTPGRIEVVVDLLTVLGRAALLSWTRGDRPAARRLLSEALGLALDERQRSEVGAGRWLGLHLTAWWFATAPGERSAHSLRAEALLAELRASGATVPPELMLRHAALSGDREAARKSYGELDALGRVHPFNREVCEAASACG